MPVRVLLGFDGSPAAVAAIEAAALLFPHSRAGITTLWAPEYSDESLRQRLWTGRGHVEEFLSAIEYEGEREARRVAATGVCLAAAAGWEPEPKVVRNLGGEGIRLAQLGESPPVEVIVVGARGLAGTRAVLGSVSDMVVHYASVPVLVVPHPLLESEHSVLAAGPVVVGFDGSAGSARALEVAHRLLPERELVRATVDDGRVPADAGRASVPEQRLTRVHLPARGGMARDTARALTSCARDTQAAVVAVGSRGRSAVREVLLGSVALATLHHAYRPVLVVPDGPGARQ